MDHRAELVEVIRRIRNRWRLRLAARGAVVVFVGTVLVLLLSASSLESFRFSACRSSRSASCGRRVRGARRLVPSGHSAAGDRHAGRAVSGRAQSVARSGDSERGRNVVGRAGNLRTRRGSSRLVEQAIAQSQAVDGMRSIAPAAPACRDARRDCAAAVALFSLGPPTYGTACRRCWSVAQRRGGGPYRIEVTPATPACRAAAIRRSARSSMASSPTGVADDAGRRTRQFERLPLMRADGPANSSKGCCSTWPADRVLRQVEGVESRPTR